MTTPFDLARISWRLQDLDADGAAIEFASIHGLDRESTMLLGSIVSEAFAQGYYDGHEDALAGRPNRVAREGC